MKNDIVSTKMAIRPRIAIEADPETMHIIKVLAVSNRMTLREFILSTIAEKYPEAAAAIEKDLKKYQ